MRGERLLVATGRRPRVAEIGLETVGIEADARGVPVDAYLRAGARLWAIGNVTGIWQLTHVGKYQGEVVKSNILGERREGELRGRAAGDLHRSPGGRRRRDGGSVPRDRAACGAGQDRDLYARVRRVEGLPHAAQRSREADGAYALGAEGGEWLQQAMLAIRAGVPLRVLRDTIQPFPTFSEIYVEALKALDGEIARSAEDRYVVG